MRKIFEMKQTIMICLIAVMLTGGMGRAPMPPKLLTRSLREENAEISVPEGIKTDAMDELQQAKVRHVRCTVDKNGTVTYEAILSSGLFASDDGMLYLFEMAPYEYNVTADTDVIASAPQDESQTTVQFTFPVNFRQEDTRLYSKFAIGIRSGGAVHLVTEPMYITNPEALAWNTLMRYPRTKKSTQGEEFNNVFMDGICYGNAELGWVFKTLQVLNTGDCEALTHPMSRADARAADARRIKNPMYYMFNASDEEGVRTLAANMEYYVANSKGGELDHRK